MHFGYQKSDLLAIPSCAAAPLPAQTAPPRPVEAQPPAPAGPAAPAKPKVISVATTVAPPDEGELEALANNRLPRVSGGSRC